MRHSFCLVCVLCVLAGAASIGKANAQKTWTRTAVLKQGDNYPFSIIGDPTDVGSASVGRHDDNWSGYVGSANLSRNANSQSTVRAVRAGEASYKVTWTLEGEGETPDVSVYSWSVASAYLESGVSSGADMVNVGLNGVAENSATTVDLQPGNSDTHVVPKQEEVVTKSGQTTCVSFIHPAASVSKAGQSFSTTATFTWISSEGVSVTPMGPDS